MEALKESLAKDSMANFNAKESELMKDVNSFVKGRVWRTSQQLQRLARIDDLEDGPCSWTSDGCPVGVLVAWAYPELVAQKICAATKKQLAEARRGFVGYLTFSGNEGKIQNDNLTVNENIAIAKAQESKIFVAAEVNGDLLNNYGIDIAQPTNHKVFMG